MAERVRMSIDGGVADVRLSRAEKLNALDLPMFRAIAEAIETLRTSTSIRAVVLSGEGRGFCAGLDMGSFAAMAGADRPEAGPEGSNSSTAPSPEAPDITARLPGRITNLFQEVAHGWFDLPVPVIAALHGPVLGGGLQIALGADIRITAPDAKLSVMEIRWGLLPDMTGPQMLPRLVGLDVAKELCFTGRTISGDEAVRLGLATRTSSKPYEDARALAEEIATKNPAAIRGAKALLNASGTRPLLESYVDESTRMAALIGSPNQVEAVMAQLGKRPAVFTD